MRQSLAHAEDFGENMHPETEIVGEFWRYVNERAHGGFRTEGEPPGGEGYPSPPALMTELYRKYLVANELGDTETMNRYLVPSLGHRDEEMVPWFDFPMDSDGYHLPPTGFPTIQEALYDYLLADVGDILIDNNYEVWLRAVTVIMADAARNPQRLVILVRDQKDPYHSSSPTTEHTMVISDDWSVLRRETFDFAVRNYKLHGHN